MITKNIFGLLLTIQLLTFSHLCAQTSSTPGQGATKPAGGAGPSTIVRPPLGGKPTDQKELQKELKKQRERERPAEFSFRPTFTSPGILALRGEGFAGVDHLYNVGNNIPVVVDLLKSESLNIPLTSAKIQEMVEAAFEKEGISVAIRPTAGPTLPFFQVLIMMIPTGEGVSAFGAGRLFEKVNLDRVVLPSGVYFQAITWEYQNLVFSSKEDMQKQIETMVAEIVQEFLSRYRFYKMAVPAAS